jgi:uncharacterized membrane protein YfcA
MEWWLAYLATGAFSGYFAGMLGIGGGLIMVPILVWVLEAQGLPGTQVLHLALGTSMAAIAFTAASSVRAHHAHRAVIWGIVRDITPGIVFGTLFGSTLAASLKTKPLSIVFSVFVYLAAGQILLNFKPKPSRGLPGKSGMFGVGSVIGGVSSLVAVGGGIMSVPFMTWCNVTMHRAIGTSAAIGLPIAVAGTLGYIVNGLRGGALPDYSLGYIYLPALVGLAAASMVTAPLGARTAHRMPVQTLRRVFAVFLLVLATRMLFMLLT